jgi:catechol 2,3-dioxygenase
MTTLPKDTRLGGVTLQVADLDRSVAWYRDVIGARLLSRGTAVDAAGVRVATMGANDDDRILLTLREQPGASPMPARGRLGLFHVAWLLPDRAALGRFIAHLAARGDAAGSADHLVSEALYLSDPDGLGVEVYADRPRDQWEVQGGEVAMASLPLDVESLLALATDVPYAGLPSGTRIGHVHLHVGALEASTRFYRDVVGFEVTQSSYPGALFLAAGGYHHHLGTNLWAGAGATPPESRDAQLLEWEVVLPSVAEVGEIAHRAVAAGALPGHAAEALDLAGAGVVLRDPWGTALRLRAG